MQAVLNSFTLTPKQWIEKTGAIGIVSKPGRYGGTYAHKDIAFEFASWVSVEFKLYLIKEFQRLKEDENQRLSLAWNLMRHLLNTYVQADPAADIGNLSTLSLTELIIETGIHDAIARKLNAKGKLSKNSVAEGIINNVRKTIIRDQLTDPRFYAEMSKLLDDLIQQRRQETIDYETFLRKAEELVLQLGKKKPVDGVPASLHGHPEAIVLFNNLARILDGDDSMVAEESPADMEERASLALKIDQTIREQAPAGWKDDIDGPRSRQVLNALFPIMNRDRQATLAVFEIIKHQAGY